MAQQQFTRDQVDAYFQGLHVGGDPESLEEMGYPSTPDRAHEQVRSAKKAAAILGRTSIAYECRDCLKDIYPGNNCPHVVVRKDGTVKIVG